MPAFLLACLAYLSVALPGSTLGLLWPSMRLSFGEPVGALGILLVFGITASVISSAATGRVPVRTAALVAGGTLLTALALAVEAFAPSLWVMAVGTVLFGLGFGAIDTALNAHAARHFGARDINWMHASYGLGATIGPLLVTALLSGGLGWRRDLRPDGARPGRPGLRVHRGPPRLARVRARARPPGGRARARGRDSAPHAAGGRGPHRADLHRRRDRHRVRGRHLGLRLPDGRPGPAGRDSGRGRRGVLGDDVRGTRGSRPGRRTPRPGPRPGRGASRAYPRAPR